MSWQGQECKNGKFLCYSHISLNPHYRKSGEQGEIKDLSSRFLCFGPSSIESRLAPKSQSDIDLLYLEIVEGYKPPVLVPLYCVPLSGREVSAKGYSLLEIFLM